MAEIIVQLGDWYCEWSTGSDSPSSPAMTLNELIEYVGYMRGYEGLLSLPERLKRVEQTGTSALNEESKSIVQFNRTGPRGKAVNQKTIIKQIVDARPERPNWVRDYCYELFLETGNLNKRAFVQEGLADESTWGKIENRILQMRVMKKEEK